MEECGYCGSKEMVGARKSSWDSMEDFSVEEIEERKTAGLSNKKRRPVHSINNPVICVECQRAVCAVISVYKKIGEERKKN